MMTLQIARVESPIGTLTLAHDGDGLCALVFGVSETALRREIGSRYGEVALREARDPGGTASRLRAYLAGDLAALDGIPVSPGGTPFQRRVWASLRRIPPGSTASYGDIARSIGEPGAVRAVGAANGANPVPIVVPCHRVIASDGRLAGYGGGIRRKEWLLRHEGLSLRAGRIEKAQAALPI